MPTESPSRRRFSAMQERLRHAELDAVLVQHGVNRRYLSGFTGSAGLLLVARERVWLLVDFRYVEQAQAEAPVCEVVYVKQPLADLARLLQEEGLTQIGFEAEHVTVRQLERLKAAASVATWVALDDWTAELRGRKDAGEVEAIQRAVDIGDAAFQHLLRTIQPGQTEQEIALELEFFMRRAGAEGLSFTPIVAAGPNGARPHAVPTERPLAPGDLLTLDFGCVKDGYCSDMTRTIGIGEVDARGRELYELVLRAQQAAVAAVRPGVSARDVDAVAREIIAEAGYGEHFGHGLGHGVGMEVHEEVPRLSPRAEGVLEPGMVCSIEPGIYLPGWGGIRIEDLVVVTDDGCRVLTQSPKTWMAV